MRFGQYDALIAIALGTSSAIVRSVAAEDPISKIGDVSSATNWDMWRVNVVRETAKGCLSRALGTPASNRP